MAHFKPIEILSFPRKPSGQSAQNRLWKSYKNALLRQDQSPVTNIACSDFFYAATSGAQIRFFDYRNANTFTISRFRNTALGGCFRLDGELFAAGDIEGKVYVFQVKKKVLLRNYKHPQPCYAVQFCDRGLFTGCDDGQLRLFDLTEKVEVGAWAAHQDYIRTVAAMGSTGVTGGMDFAVKLWDWRLGCVSELDHGAPVSAVLPVKDLLFSAGHNICKLWDLRMNKEVMQFTPHTKNVTALALAPNNTVISAGLDCYVKMFDGDSCKVFHSVKYPSPVMGLGVNPQGSHLIVGMSDGKLSVRQKKSIKFLEKTSLDEVESMYLKRWEEYRKLLPAQVKRDYKYFNRGIYSKSKDTDITVMRQLRGKMKEHDQLLRTFRYGELLDACLKEDQAEVILSVINELIQRNALCDALKQRDPDRLVLVTSWITRKITNPKYSRTLIGLGNLIFEMYSAVILLDENVKKSFEELYKVVKKEVEQQTQANEVIGMIEFLLV